MWIKDSLVHKEKYLNETEWNKKKEENKNKSTRKNLSFSNSCRACESDEDDEF